MAEKGSNSRADGGKQVQNQPASKPEDGQPQPSQQQQAAKGDAGAAGAAAAAAAGKDKAATGSSGGKDKAATGSSGGKDKAATGSSGGKDKAATGSSGSKDKAATDSSGGKDKAATGNSGKGAAADPAKSSKPHTGGTIATGTWAHRSPKDGSDEEDGEADEAGPAAASAASAASDGDDVGGDQGGHAAAPSAPAAANAGEAAPPAPAAAIAGEVEDDVVAGVAQGIAAIDLGPPLADNAALLGRAIQEADGQLPVRGVSEPDFRKRSLTLVDNGLASLLCDVATRLIILGEGKSFSFAKALAAYLTSMNRMNADVLVTAFDHHVNQPQAVPLPPAERAALQAACNANRALFAARGSDPSLLGPPQLPDVISMPPCRGNVNAKDIQGTLGNPGFAPTARNVFWFQCPWDDKDRSRVPQLLQGFLNSAWPLLRQGDYALVGVTLLKEYGYRAAYNLPGLQANGYTFVGVDNTVVNQLLRFGYQHHSDVHPIHDLIFGYHMTLCFRKN